MAKKPLKSKCSLPSAGCVYFFCSVLVVLALENEVFYAIITVYFYVFFFVL